MRNFVVMSAVAVILSSCAVTSDATSSEHQIHYWSLVEMRGLEADFDVQIPEGYVRVSNPEDWKHIRLQTGYDPTEKRIVGYRFSGCNGLFNHKAKAYENGWARTGTQVACTTFIKRIDGPTPERIEETRETVNSLRQYSEDKFLELAPQIRSESVDWDTNTFTYLGIEGETLMQFKLQEAAE